MKTIAVLSGKGGTGKTTLAAHLGAVLQAGQRRCVLVDADPQNALGQWFGMAPDERVGLARSSVRHAELMEYTRRSQPLVAYLPFGHTSVDERAELDGRLRAEPEWLVRRLGELTRHEVDVVLLDTPSGLGEWTAQACRAADLVVSVLTPDSASYATLPAQLDLLERHAASRQSFLGSYFVLNQHDPRRKLHRDVREALLNLLGDAAVPVAVPLDESIREAAAHHETLVHRYPDSQVLVALRQIAQLLLQRLDGGARQGDLEPFLHAVAGGKE